MIGSPVTVHACNRHLGDFEGNEPEGEDNALGELMLSEYRQMNEMVSEQMFFP